MTRTGTGDFDGLVALVTGGASGIGAATVRLLLSRGARVASFDRTDVGVPDGALSLIGDVTDTQTIDAAVEQLTNEYQGIDVLVNNAGIGAVGDVTANDEAAWQRVFDVNVIGIMRMSTACLPYLRASDHAAIVHTSSAVATVGVRSRALYSATKGAVHALTLAMAADHVSEGVRVNAVSPGTTDTPWVGRLLGAADDAQEADRALRARQAIGRLVTAEEVANAIAYLASPSAASTTGSVLAVDGGFVGLRV